MNREELANVVEARHASRVVRACQHVQGADTADQARDRLADAIRALPGVATDPDTVLSIMMLVDHYVQRREAT